MVQYAVFVWRHKNLALAELALVSSQIDHLTWDWYSVSVSNPHILSRLAWIVKRWILLSAPDLLHKVDPAKVVGVSDRTLWVWLKKSVWLKRFKEIDLLKKDVEVVASFQEVHALTPVGQTHRDAQHPFSHDGAYVWVTGWQDIERFSVLDIEKPIRGMDVGMMPAKLAQMMVNIGVAAWQRQSILHAHEVPTIYDPFCGFGTTCFVANSLWYNALGSDLRITSAKENFKWWKTTSLALERPLTLFKHDATLPVDKPFIRNTNVIVTEWWLGPIMHRRLQPKDIEDRVRRVVGLWTSWLDVSVSSLWRLPIVCSLPSYQLDGREQVLSERICTHAASLGYSVEYIDVYKRPRQLVARQIVVLTAR
jgi:hypothetical protein